MSTGETIPGNAVPDNSQRGTDAAWKSWITNGFSSVAHPVGTAAVCNLRSQRELMLMISSADDEGIMLNGPMLLMLSIPDSSMFCVSSVVLAVWDPFISAFG